MRAETAFARGAAGRSDRLSVFRASLEGDRLCRKLKSRCATMVRLSSKGPSPSWMAKGIRCRSTAANRPSPFAAAERLRTNRFATERIGDAASTRPCAPVLNNPTTLHESAVGQGTPVRPGVRQVAFLGSIRPCRQLFPRPRSCLPHRKANHLQGLQQVRTSSFSERSRGVRVLARDRCA